ncbi:MAG: hypothetical protein IIA53_09485, partial [Chloroflexi bacterium]|nr:hypothetical protein [Chloroflexota bacterium]
MEGNSIMAFNTKKITENDGGDIVSPESTDDWRDWVSASDTRNFVLEDPRLDWLELHGEANGFVKDIDVPGYDERLDFGVFVTNQGNLFEGMFMAWLDERVGVETIGDSRVARSLDAVERTTANMERGTEIIAQGVLRNPENRTYGQPDLLMRLDVLLDLFPDARRHELEFGGLNNGVPEPEQYRVIDIKFSTIGLVKKDDTVDGSK